LDEESWWAWKHASSIEKDMKESRFERIAEYAVDYCYEPDRESLYATRM